MLVHWLAGACAAAVLAACGSGVPESPSAKRVGEAPKQALERAAEDAAKAVQQGAERARAD